MWVRHETWDVTRCASSARMLLTLAVGGKVVANRSVCEWPDGGGSSLHCTRLFAVVVKMS